MRALLALLFAFPLLAAPRHVVIIGVDGLGGAGLAAAKAPRLRELMGRGASTMAARGVLPTVSSPNWASILMAAGPEEHGIDSNEWQLARHAITPVCAGPDGHFPTLFFQLQAQRPGARAAAIHDWKDFGRLVEPAAASLIRHVEGGSGPTVDAAIAYFRERRPVLLFVHLDDVDHAGHGKGWESPEYAAAVETIDGHIGRLLDALPLGETLVIVTADHGGTGTRHGNPTDRELLVPWIAAGPGIARGRDLTGHVRSLDTAPTVLRALGLAPHPCWIGRAVEAAFASR